MHNEPIVIIGAGQTGRGFIGRLLAERQCDFVLIDKEPALVERLQEPYTVEFFAERVPVVVSPYRVLSVDDPAVDDFLQRASLLFTAVGGENLPAVGKMLQGKLSESTNIIVCENAQNAGEHLQNTLLPAATIGIVNGAVFCTTINIKIAKNIIIKTNFISISSNSKVILIAIITSCEIGVF